MQTLSHWEFTIPQCFICKFASQFLSATTQESSDQQRGRMCVQVIYRHYRVIYLVTIIGLGQIKVVKVVKI